MPKLRVLIVGASIAGPCAAYWFAKAGATVTVVERFPHLRTNGQNVDIRTSGVTVMRRIPGMEVAVRANTLELEGIALLRGNGKPYGIMNMSGNPEQQTLVSEYEIFRGRLSKILHDLTKNHERVKYIFNEQVATIKQGEGSNGPAKVEFMNGTAAGEYDVVVACDGATSRTRAIGMGCGIRDHIYPVGVWAAYFSIGKDLINGSQLGHGYGSTPGRLMTIAQDPEGGNMVTLMTTDPESQGHLREALKEGEHALKEFITKRYQDAGWKTEEVLEGMMGSKNLYASEAVQVKVPSLYKGCFVLVGDSGYAPGLTGTGTTLALTGAYVLAGEICKHNGNLKAGLEGYEKTMRPLITSMTKQPPFVTSLMAPQTAWGLWLRNNIFGLIAWANIPQFFQWVFGSASGKVDEFPIPDYEWVE